ncbi:hypothetical protein SDJN02_12729, partial [Cucurbita argyrosperma subsp. argyrosperma]
MAAIFSVVVSLIVLLTAVRVFAMSPPTGCATRELLLLSPCLPYISASPIRYGSFSLLRAVSSAYDSIRRHFPMLLSSRTSDLGLSVEQYEADRSVFVFFSLNGGMYLEKNNSLDSLCAGMNSKA